jgi:LPS export ABC transporter protein LptC
MNHKSCVAHLCATILFASCSNSVKNVEELTSTPLNYPLNEQRGATITYSDSGQKLLEIHAGLVQDYGNLDPAYMFFGERIQVQFYYDKTLNSTILEADTARQLKDDDIWAIGGNVILTNGKGERMKTERLYWDKKEERLYSDASVEIYTDGQLISGEGFEADQEFNTYRIFKVQGEITIDDE